MMRGCILVVPAVASSGLLSAEKEFSLQEANKLVRLSQLAFCNASSSPDVLDWSCQTCRESDVSAVPGTLTFVHGDKANNSQALVGKLGKQPGCFIAFRGTNSTANWISDAEIWYYNKNLTDFPECNDCRVHYGFYKTWESMRDPIHKALREAGCTEENENPLYLTGHSMGAAMAHLAALTLFNRGYKIALMYSFEAPRVGNAAFAAAWDSLLGPEFPCYRLTHDHDPVVHFPPESFGFLHVNTEIYFGETGSDYRVCEVTEGPTCSNHHNNIFSDLYYYWFEHSALPAFGDGFRVPDPKCSAPKFASVSV